MFISALDLLIVYQTKGASNILILSLLSYFNISFHLLSANISSTTINFYKLLFKHETL